MMRLLLTLLAALGFAWAFNSARAEETAPAARSAIIDAGDSIGPRQFGAKSGDARIVVEAKEETWVRSATRRARSSSCER